MEAHGNSKRGGGIGTGGYEEKNRIQEEVSLRGSSRGGGGSMI